MRKMTAAVSLNRLATQGRLASPQISAMPRGASYLDQDKPSSSSFTAQEREPASDPSFQEITEIESGVAVDDFLMLQTKSGGHRLPVSTSRDLIEATELQQLAAFAARRHGVAGVRQVAPPCLLAA